MSHIISPPPPGFILPPPPPYHFAPMERNCLMIYTIYPCPISFCPLERNRIMIYTIYPCPVSVCPLDWTLGVGLLCFNRMLGQMHLNFAFILIKSPLRQNLMTGAHPVTVAPLVMFRTWISMYHDIYIWLKYCWLWCCVSKYSGMCNKL